MGSYVLRLILLLVIFTVNIDVIRCRILELEAEHGTSYPIEAQRSRSTASNDATVALLEGNFVTLHLSVITSCLASVNSVSYTNDGGSDTISVNIDGTFLGSFQTIGESNFGNNWNVVRQSTTIGSPFNISSGTHAIRVVATMTDQYGVEIDKVTMNLNDECETSIQCTEPPDPVAIPSSGTCISSQGRIEQQSVTTNCAEEDNIHIPLYFNRIRQFTITATTPEYASLTALNNRMANFTNCELTSRTIWMIGNEDMTSSEFTTACDTVLSTVHVSNQTMHICGELNSQNRNEIIVVFNANGPSSGQVESAIGSLLQIQFAQVTGSLTIQAAVYGRQNIWLPFIDQGVFSSSSRSFTWQIPDLTWREGENMIRLTVNSSVSSTDARGTFDYIKLEKRPERGEFEIAEIYNDGITIIKAIGKDFWWLHPQSMIVRNSQSGSQWSNVVYIRVLRKIPSINSWPEVFVLYHDGNSRVLNFPPSHIDWIPYGSSVIIGPSNPNSVRPYALISQIDFDPMSLKFKLYFAAGGEAVMTVNTNSLSTIVNVSNITYARDPTVPFATFRSMWVSDGNSDVDHVSSETSVEHITSDGWNTLTGSNFLFFRTCVSLHNTLSPNIRVQIQCVGDDSVDEPLTTPPSLDTTTPSLDTTTPSLDTTTTPSLDTTGYQMKVQAFGSLAVLLCILSIACTMM